MHRTGAERVFIHLRENPGQAATKKAISLE
jgi:hypothetical protein